MCVCGREGGCVGEESICVSGECEYITFGVVTLEGGHVYWRGRGSMREGKKCVGVHVVCS